MLMGADKILYNAEKINIIKKTNLLLFYVGRYIVNILLSNLNRNEIILCTLLAVP